VLPQRSPVIPRIHVAFLERKNALMERKLFKPGVSSFQLHSNAIDDVALADQEGKELTYVVAIARSPRPRPISAGCSLPSAGTAPSRTKNSLSRVLPNTRMQLTDPPCHAPGCKATALVPFGIGTLRDFGVC
jgi:hypothetical protein